MRQCIICNTKIEACMGFVLARDIVDKRIPAREICGKCGLMILEMDETQLERCLPRLPIKSIRKGEGQNEKI